MSKKDSQQEEKEDRQTNKGQTVERGLLIYNHKKKENE